MLSDLLSVFQIIVNSFPLCAKKCTDKKHFMITKKTMLLESNNINTVNVY